MRKKLSQWEAFIAPVATVFFVTPASADTDVIFFDDGSSADWYLERPIVGPSGRISDATVVNENNPRGDTIRWQVSTNGAFVAGFYTRPEWVYDPSTEGPISSIDVSMFGRTVFSTVGGRFFLNPYVADRKSVV